MPSMEPASSIITKLGGSAKVAEIVGRHRTQVARWRWDRSRGGTDGRVPQEHINKLLAYAREHDIAVGLADFFAEPEAA